MLFYFLRLLSRISQPFSLPPFSFPLSSTSSPFPFLLFCSSAFCLLFSVWSYKCQYSKTSPSFSHIQTLLTLDETLSKFCFYFHFPWNDLFSSISSSIFHLHHASSLCLHPSDNSSSFPFPSFASLLPSPTTHHHHHHHHRHSTWPPPPTNRLGRLA